MWPQLLAGAVAAAAILGAQTVALSTAYAKGDAAGYARRDAMAWKAATEASERARQAEREQAARVVAADAAEASRAAQSRIVYRTIREAIPSHVTPEIDRRYPVSVQLARLYDASLGLSALADLDAPGQLDGAAATVPASDAARVFTDNGEACRDSADRLLALQALVRGQAGYRGP